MQTRQLQVGGLGVSPIDRLLVSGSISIYKRLCDKINNAKAANCQLQLACLFVWLRQIFAFCVNQLLPQSVALTARTNHSAYA